MNSLKISKRTRKEHGYSVEFWQVTGVDSDGQRIRKRFQDRGEALKWMSLRDVSLLNDTAQLHSAVTVLSPSQVKEAEAAFSRLGTRYSITEAVDFFVKNHCEPDFKINVHTAFEKCSDAKKVEGVRPKSLKQFESTLNQFFKHCGHEWLHEITTHDVEQYLKSLRARDGVKPATKKTWNNYRADIHAFLSWCVAPPRQWIPQNAASHVVKHRNLKRGVPGTLTVSRCEELMRYVAGFKEGRLVPYFALALFTGIRSDTAEGEIAKLAARADELIDMERGVIHVPPEVSKTEDYRQIMIRPNLAAWLVSFPGPILPPNHDRDIKDVRKLFKIGHDYLRHTFFSMHVAAFKSVGEAAIEGGNTEAVLKKHYLNLASYKEGSDFWRIMPEKSGSKIVRMA